MSSFQTQGHWMTCFCVTELGHACVRIPRVLLLCCRDTSAIIARTARIGHDSVIGPSCTVDEESEVSPDSYAVSS